MDETPRRAARAAVAHLIHVIRDRVPAGDRERVRAAGPLDMASITDGASRDAAAGPAHADRFGTCVVGRAGDGGVYGVRLRAANLRIAPALPALVRTAAQSHQSEVARAVELPRLAYCPVETVAAVLDDGDRHTGQVREPVAQDLRVHRAPLQRVALLLVAPLPFAQVDVDVHRRCENDAPPRPRRSRRRMRMRRLRRWRVR